MKYIVAFLLLLLMSYLLDSMYEWAMEDQESWRPLLALTGAVMIWLIQTLLIGLGLGVMMGSVL